MSVDCFYLYALDHKHQVGPGYLAGITPQCGHRKAPALQTLAVQHESAPLPVKQFNQGAATVQKDKYFPAGRLAAQLIADQTAQSIEGLAHVTHPTIQLVGERVA